MSSKRFLAFLSMVMVLALALAGCGGGGNQQASSTTNQSQPAAQAESAAQGQPTAKPAETITLRGVTAWPKNDDANNTGFVMLQEKIAQHTDGRVKLEWVGGPEVISPFELGEAVRKGVVDVGWLSAAYYMPAIPEAGALDFTNLSVAEQRSSGAFEYLNQIHQKKLNAYLLGRGSVGAGYALYTTKPIEKIEDFKGLRIRVSPVYVPFIKALGAEPVTMPGGEIYTALERGVIQGFTWPEIGIGVMKLDELTKFKIYPPYWEIDIVTLVNLDRWNKLPKDLQDALTQAAIELEQEIPSHFKEYVGKENQHLESLGVKFVRFEGAEAEKYLKTATDAGWAWMQENVKEDADKLIDLFTK